ncbi:iron ABC transporter permease [Vogesella sp. LIG4]|uniref:ABC transporter permease n=1 Tax=Vogesella sp. LIG4 TaxID=1192162 RepID=UPI000B5ACCF0|nr:ABC transporter permease subunit [Vogesella sp. LIG4]
MVAAPLARLLWQGGVAFSPALLQDSYLQWRLAWSLGQALASCLLCLLIGLPLAWVLARYDFPGRRLLLRLLLLPFVMPTLVAGLGVLALFGPHGVSGINLQDTPWLLLYGNLFYNLPLLVRAGVDGLAQVPASRLQAARTLGATPWRCFWRVEWPVLRPWLGSALCLIFLYCFAGFGLALLLGGQRYATVEVEIYSLVAYELNLADAGALALLALAVGALAVGGYAWVERRLVRDNRPGPTLCRPPQGWPQRLQLLAALLLLALCCAAPLAAIVWRALQADAASWRSLWDGEVLGAIGNTLRFSAGAVLLALLLGLTHGVAAARWWWLRGLGFLPFMVSPVMLAFGLLLLYPQFSASLGLLLAAYALLGYPFVAKAVAAALASLPPSLPAAARTLGATRWRAFLRVSLPLIRPALRRGLAFAAATAVGEFAVTLFLSRPEWTTLTTLIYQRLGRPGAANLQQAMLLTCLLLGFALLAFLIIEWPEKHRAAD